MAWTIDGASYSGVTQIVATNRMHGFFVTADGLRLFCTSSYTNQIYEYTLSTAFDLSTIGGSPVSINAPPQSISPVDVTFSADGLRMSILSGDNDRLYEYTLSTPWDVSTATWTYTYLSIGGDGPMSVRYAPDGTKFWAPDTVNDSVYECVPSEPWRVQLSEPMVGFDVSSQTTFPDAIEFYNAGANAVLSDSATGTLYQYDLSTPWDFSTAVYNGVSIETSAVVNDGVGPRSITIDDASGIMLMSGYNEKLYQYQLYDPTYTPAVVPDNGDLFYLTLTGSADSVDDVVIPVKSVFARLRSGARSYLQVTIPYTDEIAVLVSARPNADLILTHSRAGTDTVITTVDLELIQTSRGQSSSIVLTGHRQTTNASPAAHTIVAQAVQAGTARSSAIVPGFNPLIRAGDDVTVEGNTYTIGVISLQAAASGVQMQLIEG